VRSVYTSVNVRTAELVIQSTVDVPVLRAGRDDSVNRVNTFLMSLMSAGREGKLSGLFCAILCATVVHSELHTHMNRPNSSLDWVLSHWAHFTMFRLIFVYVLFCV